MESKENRSDASTPLLRQPSAADSLMSTSSATADSGVPPTEEMDTGSAVSSSNATSNHVSIEMTPNKYLEVSKLVCVRCYRMLACSASVEAHTYHDGIIQVQDTFVTS